MEQARFYLPILRNRVTRLCEYPVEIADEVLLKVAALALEAGPELDGGLLQLNAMDEALLCVLDARNARVFAYNRDKEAREETARNARIAEFK